jgi:hypothetical protein
MAKKRVSQSESVVSSSGAAASAHRGTPAPRVRRATPAAATPAVRIRRAAPVAQSSLQPTHAEIAAKAYSYWVARGGQGGSPEADWLRAETELLGRKLATEA